MEKGRENKTLHRGSEGFGLKGKQVEKREKAQDGERGAVVKNDRRI